MFIVNLKRRDGWSRAYYVTSIKRGPCIWASDEPATPDATVTVEGLSVLLEEIMAHDPDIRGYMIAHRALTCISDLEGAA